MKKKGLELLHFYYSGSKNVSDILQALEGIENYLEN
jgi:hypothetical protein